MERQNGPAGPRPTHTRHPHLTTPEKTRRESPRWAYCKIWASPTIAFYSCPPQAGRNRAPGAPIAPQTLYKRAGLERISAPGLDTSHRACYGYAADHEGGSAVVKRELAWLCRGEEDKGKGLPIR
jgi:hypothetical protein